MNSMTSSISISAQERVLFIYDRAKTLVFEARRWPQTFRMARAWLFGAAVYAMNHGYTGLADCIISELENLEESVAAELSGSDNPADSANISQARRAA